MKRVVTLDKTGQSICDDGGHERLDKIFEIPWDEHNEVSMETKKKKHMLRHWECATKSEELQLKFEQDKHEIEMQERKEMQWNRMQQDKHEIEMQERKNTLEMQQDEHKRRMNSTLW